MITEALRVRNVQDIADGFEYDVCLYGYNNQEIRTRGVAAGEYMQCENGMDLELASDLLNYTYALYFTDEEARSNAFLELFTASAEFNED